MDPQAWELKTKILTEVIDAMFGDHPFTPEPIIARNYVSSKK